MQILNIFHVLVAIALVGLVLIQKGQGATAGASFGAGASATVFGARGAGTFLTRATWVMGALFCAISLTMAVVVSRTVGVPDTGLGVVADSPAQEETAADGAEPPPGAELSVADEAQAADDRPAIDSGNQEVSDVPAFEPPEGADAIEGSEVRDEIPPEDGQPEESTGESADGDGAGPGI